MYTKQSITRRLILERINNQRDDSHLHTLREGAQTCGAGAGKFGPDHCQNLWILTWINTKDSRRSGVRLLTQIRNLGEGERGQKAEQQRLENLSTRASFTCGQRQTRESGARAHERHQVRRRAGWLHLSLQRAGITEYIYRERDFFFFWFPLTICISPPISHKDKASGVLHVISKYVLSLYCVLILVGALRDTKM